MRALDGVSAGKVASRRGFARLALAACLCAAPALAQTAAAPEIVEPTGNLKPEYSKNPDPSSRDLIETWRSANLAIAGKRVDQEKFAILARRVAPGKIPGPFCNSRSSRRRRTRRPGRRGAARAASPRWSCRSTINGARI